MNCKRCGAELDEHDQFCYSCGFDVSMDRVIGNDIVDNLPVDNKKPIKARFSSNSPEKFDSSLESLSSRNKEDSIGNALKNESFNSFDNSTSHTSGSKMHKIPKRSNKTATSIFAVLLFLFLGGVAGSIWLSGPENAANILPAMVNQTNYTPENYTNQTEQPNNTQVVEQNTTNPNSIRHSQNINKDSTCSYCGGKGKIMCSSCGGSGFLTCSKCGGDGSLENGESCESCGGQGRVVCLKCQATGYITCPKCGGTGHN